MDLTVTLSLPRIDETERALIEALSASAPGHMALAVRMVGSRQDAAEVLQEAWLRAWRHRGAVREPGAQRAWLRRIVVRECLRTLRWRQARSWLSFRDVVPEARDPEPGVDERLGDARRREAVRRAAASLSPRQRLVWGLRFDEGWSVREIAESTGLGVETVRTHLGRALARIQTRLEDEDVL